MRRLPHIAPRATPAPRPASALRGRPLQALALLACLVAALGGHVATAGARAALLPQLLSAAPVAAPGDGRSRDDDGIAWRVTASPDHDGRRDLPTVATCAPTRTSLQLRVYAWARPQGWMNVWNGPARTTGRRPSSACHALARAIALEQRAAHPVPPKVTRSAGGGKRTSQPKLVLPALGRTPLGWSGQLADGSPAPDGGYMVTVCRANASIAASPGHARRAVAASVRTARAWRSQLATIDAGDESVGGPGTAPGATDPDLVATPGERRRGHAASSIGDETPTLGEPAGAIPAGRRGGCLAAPVQVQLRRLAIAVEGAGSIVAGADAPIRVAADEPAVHVAITTSGDPTPLTADQLVAPGHAVVPVPATLAPGLYRLVASDDAGNRRSAPLVVRSAAPLEAPAAGTALVVFPYLTWRAYDRTDVDRDGRPDTWYQDWSQRFVSLAGPYVNGASTDVPAGAEADEPHERAFMGWLTSVPRPVQAITDVELGTMSVAQLARYPLVVFPGHTEYYEPATWHLLDAYRAGGGNIALLSANNFFRAVRLTPAPMTSSHAFARDLAGTGGSLEMVEVLSRDTDDARSDFRLAGVGFSCCVVSGDSAQYEVTDDAMAMAPWAFAGTGLHPGDRWGTAGVEVDAPDVLSSPRSQVVLATADIGRLRGGVGAPPVATIALSREGPGGGEDFATGNMRFVSLLASDDLATRAVARRLLENAWSHLLHA